MALLAILLAIVIYLIVAILTKSHVTAALFLLVVINFATLGIIYQKRIAQNPDPGVVEPSPPEEFSPLPEQPETPPETVPEFVVVEKHRPDADDGSVLGDVISHSKGRPFGNAHGRATNAHETTHGINSELRNAHPESTKVNAFYCLQGRGAILYEPDCVKNDCKKFLPENIRSYRYQLYIRGQQAWNDRPLYIFDEWIAYINGATTNVDDVKNGRHDGEWTDGVSGCLGFSIFSVSIAMAV